MYPAALTAITSFERLSYENIPYKTFYKKCYCTLIKSKFSQIITRSVMVDTLDSESLE